MANVDGARNSSMNSIRSKSSGNFGTGYFSRWRLFWVGIPENITQHVVGIDLTGLWRRHLIWSKPAGSNLRFALTERFSSTTVFLSLILGAEIGILFSPSAPLDAVRNAFRGQDFSVEYWAGAALSMAILITISAVIANFTAWSVFSVVSNENLKLVARSSIGLYGATLPSRLVIGVIYSFFLTIALFWFVLMTWKTALFFTVIGSILITHIVSTYSALGQIVMSTAAMSSHRVLEKNLEDEMLPPDLAEVLLKLTQEAKRMNIPVNIQYRALDQHSDGPEDGTAPILSISTTGSNNRSLSSVLASTKTSLDIINEAVGRKERRNDNNSNNNNEQNDTTIENKSGKS